MPPTKRRMRLLAQKLAVTEEQMIDLRLAGDLTIAAFFAADKPKDRETRRKDLAEKFRRARERVTDLELDDELRGAVRVLKTGPKGRHAVPLGTRIPRGQWPIRLYGGKSTIPRGEANQLRFW